jgi:hypothetical protein
LQPEFRLCVSKKEIHGFFILNKLDNHKKNLAACIRYRGMRQQSLSLGIQIIADRCAVFKV